MSPRAAIRSLILALALAGCGDDTLPQPVPDPDLIVSGRLMDDLGQPIDQGLIEGYLVTIPSVAVTSPASAAPSCDNAAVPSGTPPDDEAESAPDGSFSLSIVGLDGPLCLVVGVREAGQPPEAAVILPPRLVSPASTSPVTVSLGEIAIGQLDHTAK